MQATEIIGVVTASFFAPDAEGINRALRELLRLGINRAILVYDRKMQDRLAYVAEARKEMEPCFDQAGGWLEAHEVDSFDTAFRWRDGLSLAVVGKGAAAAFLYTGDLLKDPTPENQRGHEEMVRLAAEDALVLGDYACGEWFKSEFNRLIGLPVVELLFPDLFGRLVDLENSKIRTEFLVVGAAVWRRFEEWTGHIWGPDPTVVLTLDALEAAGLHVPKAVWLGTVQDDPGHRRPLGLMHQILRYASYLLVDRLYYEMARKPSLSRQLAIYDGLAAVSAKLDARVQDALRTVRTHLP